MKGRKLTMDICDYSKNYVCNLYDSQANIIGQATDVFLQQQRNGWKQLSFNIPSVTISGNKPEKNYRLDYIKADYYIKVTGDVLDGQDYYVISQPKIQHSAFSTNVSVTCSHISSLLKLKNLGLQFSDDFGNNIGTARQLLTTVLAGSGWQVGDVYDFAETFDPSIVKYRTLTAPAKTGAFKLVQEICNLFDAKPVYHGKTNKVDLLPINPFSDQSDVFDKQSNGTLGNVIELQYGKNLSNLSRTLNTQNIVTKLYAYGSFGDKVKGYCGIDECTHTQYTIVPTSTLTAGTKYKFTVMDDSGLNITRAFVPKENIAAGRTIVYSFLDPQSMSYVWVRPTSESGDDGFAIEVSQDTIGAQSIAIDQNRYIAQFTDSIRGSTIYTVGNSTNNIVNCFMYVFNSGDTRYGFVSSFDIQKDTIATVDLQSGKIKIGDDYISIFNIQNVESFQISEKEVHVVNKDFDANKVEIRIGNEQLTTKIPVATIDLPANKVKKKNYFSFLLDFSYYKKIGLLTDEDLNLIGKYQNESQSQYKIVETNSLELAKKQTQLAQTIGSVNFAKIAISRVYDDGLLGPNIVLRLNTDSDKYDNGVIYRSDYNAVKKNRFRYITTDSLDDNGDPINSGASVLYIIPSNWNKLSPKRWIKAYVKQVDDDQDPTTITLWLNASEYAGIISADDSFYVFQSNNINGKLGTYESYDESLLRSIQKNTTVTSIQHPVYFGPIPPSTSIADDPEINTNDPSVAQLIKRNQAYFNTLDGYAWYWQYNPNGNGTLYFCRKSRTNDIDQLTNDSNWKIVYVQDTDDTSKLSNIGYMFNWKSSKLFKYSGSQWKYLDDYTSKQISSYFGTVYASCLQRDKYYKGIYRYYGRRNQPTRAGNYYFENAYGDFYTFTIPEDVLNALYDTDTGWMTLAKADGTQLDTIKPKIYRFDNVKYHQANILDGVMFQDGTINSVTGALTQNENDQQNKRTASVIPVVPNTEYLFSETWDSAKNAGITRIHQYDYNGNWLKSSEIKSASSYSVSSSTYYVRFVANSNIDASKSTIVANNSQITIIIDDTNYTKIDYDSITDNPVKGILSYMNQFLALSNECYNKLLPSVTDAQNTVKEFQNQITSELGMTYRQGYWQSDNYVDGDEDRLYADAIDNLKKISQPQVSYSINYVDLFAANKDMMFAVDESLSGADYPDVTTSSPIHLIDDELDIDCWAYVDRLKKCYDVPERTTLQINTNLTTMSQHSFSDVMSNIADVASTAKGNASKYNSTSQTAPTMNEVIDVVNSMIASDRKLQSTYTQIQDINDTLITNQSTIKQTAEMIQTQVVRAKDSQNYIKSSIQQTANQVQINVFNQLVDNNILKEKTDGSYGPGSAIQGADITEQLVENGVLVEDGKDDKGNKKYKFSDKISNSDLAGKLKEVGLITVDSSGNVESINDNIITKQTNFTVSDSGIKGTVQQIVSSVYVNSMNQTINSVNGQIIDVYPNWVIGKYALTGSVYTKYNGQTEDNQDYKYCEIQCVNGNQFILKNIVGGNNTKIAAYAFVNADGDILSERAQTNLSITSDSRAITAPQNAVKLIVNDNYTFEIASSRKPSAIIQLNAATSTYGQTINQAQSTANTANTVATTASSTATEAVKAVNDVRIDSMNYVINSLNGQLLTVSPKWLNGYVKTGTSSGTPYSNYNNNPESTSSAWKHCQISCVGGNEFILKNIKGGIAPAAWAFVDSQNNIFEERAKSNLSISSSGISITAPENAVILVVNNNYGQLTGEPSIQLVNNTSAYGRGIASAQASASDALGTANDALGAASDALDAAGDALDVLNSNTWEQINPTWVSSKYVTTSGATYTKKETTSTSWRYCQIQCSQNDIFYIERISGGSSPRAWAFVTGQNNGLNDDYRAKSSTSIDTNGLILVAPAEAKLLVLNDNTSGHPGTVSIPGKFASKVLNTPAGTNSNSGNIVIWTQKNQSTIAQTQAQINSIVRQEDTVELIDPITGLSKKIDSSYKESKLKQTIEGLQSVVSDITQVTQDGVTIKQSLSTILQNADSIVAAVTEGISSDEVHTAQYQKYDPAKHSIEQKKYAWDNSLKKYVQVSEDERQEWATHVLVYSLDADGDGMQLKSSSLSITPNQINISSSGAFTVDAQNITIDREGTLSASNAYLSGNIYNIDNGIAYPVLSSNDIYVGYTQPKQKHRGLIWIRPTASATPTVPQQDTDAMQSQKVQVVFHGTDPSNVSKRLDQYPLSLKVSGTGCNTNRTSFTYQLYVTLRRQSGSSANYGGAVHAKLGNTIQINQTMPSGSGEIPMVFSITTSTAWLPSSGVTQIPIQIWADDYSGGSCNNNPTSITLKCYTN